ELELLDEITRLRYLGKMPPGTVGETRSSVLKNFRLLKGIQYLPPKIHSAIVWSEIEPFEISDESQITWKIVSTENTDRSKNLYRTGNFKSAKTLEKAQETIVYSEKRDVSDTNPDENGPETKKQKTLCDRNIASDSSLPSHHKTLSWSENSCAYDSVIMLLFHVYLAH
ncbi:hypothetical protein K435DRAFT_556261, partial [Dendrothele bispora CBS 962.96]